MTLIRSLTANGVRVEYARTRPAEAISVTKPFAIGVAFTPQPLAVWDIGTSKKRRDKIPPSAVLITAEEPLNWQKWTNVSESVEMWLDRRLLDALSLSSGGPATVRYDHRELVSDPVVAGVAAAFRSAMFAAEPWSALRLEALGWCLASHFLNRYHGVPVNRESRVRKLPVTVIDRIADCAMARLHGPILLRDLAALANQSPHHFAKSFKATTGRPPHAFLTALRMDHAMVLLRNTRLPVRAVAEQVGFTSFSHFLVQFRRYWGTSPAQFRALGG